MAKIIEKINDVQIVKKHNKRIAGASEKMKTKRTQPMETKAGEIKIRNKAMAGSVSK